MSLTVVRLVGLECYGFHGVSDAEQELGHRFRIDVDLGVEESASDTDLLEETVDYDDIARDVVAIVEGEKCRTVERIAGKIAADLLEDNPTAEWVEVSVIKVAPPIPFVIAGTGVRVRRDRAK
jgi:dihydroneopterin aldolase